MKCLVYQYWNGDILPGVSASVKNISKYCDSIGVDHVFEHNPMWMKKLYPTMEKPLHYDCFKPVYDKVYEEYDYYLFLDVDIFTVDDLTDNIFLDFIASGSEIGMAEETGMAEQRMLNLKKNNSHISENQFAKLVSKSMPKDKNGYNKVYNSGVVLYSKEGMRKFRDTFMTVLEYQTLARQHKLLNVYVTDQNYLQAMIFRNDIDFFEIDSSWNTILRTNPKDNKVLDLRNGDSKFIHIQFKSADHNSAELHWKMTNLPVDKWGGNWEKSFV